MKFAPPPYLKLTLLGCLITSLTACGMLEKYDRRIDYKKSTTAPRLEMPPNLQATLEDELVIPGSGDTVQANYSDYERKNKIEGSNGKRQRDAHILPSVEGITIQRAGDVRWLHIEQPAEKVWVQARDFWLESGFLLKREDGKLGIVETEWNENRGDIPEDIVRKTLGGLSDFLWSASTRDKFRVRVERVDNNNSELYLSHRGAEQVLQSDTLAWQYRPNDAQLEAEMLTRLMMYLGVKEEQARQKMASSNVTKDKSERVNDVLKVHESFKQTWRRTGLALDRLGFSVEDRNRETGIYFVRYVPNETLDDNKGFFDRVGGIFGSDDAPESEDYQIKVQEEGDITHIRILNKEGEAAAKIVATRILDLLQTQLR